MKRIPPSAAAYQTENYSRISIQTRIRKVLFLIVVTLAAAMGVKADDCPPDSNNDGQNISAQITIAATGRVLSNGSFVAPYTSLRLDAAAAAYGNCTPMLADCSSSPCSCTPLQTYERTIDLPPKSAQIVI